EYLFIFAYLSTSTHPAHLLMVPDKGSLKEADIDHEPSKSQIQSESVELADIVEATNVNGMVDSIDTSGTVDELDVEADLIQELNNAITEASIAKDLGEMN
ncbi:hypothetical protein HAX54_052402, partial [Datura stramonium]|nr:hypothetical protein [Datura stramonium]